MTLFANFLLIFSALLLAISGIRAAAVEKEGHLLRQKRAGILTSIDYEAEATERDSPSVCGIRRNSVPDIFTRIVGGTVAEKNEFPWQVSLQWRYNWLTYHVCGATILNEYWVVTAAHCTHAYRPGDLVVVGGLHNVKRKDASQQERSIQRIAEHWGYSPSTQENDIALLRLNRPFQMNGMSVAPVCLPPVNHNFNDNCVVSGWGKLSEDGQSPEELRKVVVPIISRQKCAQSYRLIGFGGKIADTMLCAGYSQGVKDACQGDSGGPFVCRGRDNRYMLAGIVSWGVGCARPNVPGVYTKVSRYIEWMRSIVNGRSEVTERAASIPTSLHLDDIVSEGGDLVSNPGDLIEGNPENLSTISSHLEESNAGKDFSSAVLDFTSHVDNHFGGGVEDYEKKDDSEPFSLDHSNGPVNFYDDDDDQDDLEEDDFDAEDLDEEAHHSDGLNIGDDVISGLYYPGGEPIDTPEFGINEPEADSANLEFFQLPKNVLQN